MTIGLYGIGGLYNYGCEAIVRGTVIILKQLLPDCKIIYFSRRADEDRIRIPDLDIEIIQVSYKRNIFLRIINKLLKMIKSPFRIPYDNFKLICDKCDTIISIGGDIYTIPFNTMYRTRNYNYYNNMVHFGEYAKARNKKLIILGASIGPFGNK